VKEVVWHEVAHWLGHSEQEVKELGLATLTIPREPVARHDPESEQNEADEKKESQLHCLKCYSADVTCRELDKPLSTGSWLSEPVSVHAKMCTCNSCGYEWDDEDNT